MSATLRGQGSPGVHRVLVTEPIAPAALELLSTCTAVDVRTNLSVEELLAIIPVYDALIIRSGTRVGADVIATGERLRVIGRAGSGLDNIDLAAAVRHGITVLNTPEANTIAVAELTIGLMIALIRQLPQAITTLSEGRWERNRLLGGELHGKVLGLVGLGRIGAAVAQRAHAFGLTILAYDPYVAPAHAQQLNVTLTSLQELLAQSDIVSLHVPLTLTNYHLLSALVLKSLKSGAYVINTARGELIDDAALLELLDTGKCGGAALDVFALEPPVHNTLVNHHKVLATPHVGATTVEAQQRAGLEIASRVMTALGIVHSAQRNAA